MSNEYAEESHEEDNENETYQPSLNSDNEEIPKSHFPNFREISSKMFPLSMMGHSSHPSSQQIYKCGCGKSYLSYPALYTHIKNKHNGKQPDGTIMPINPRKGKRGRPRKDGPLPGQMSLPAYPMTFDAIPDPRNSLRDIFSVPESYAPYDPFKIFPKTFFANHEDYIPLLTQMEMIFKYSQKLDDEPFNKEARVKATPVNRIMAYFLLEAQKALDHKSWTELCYFICLYRKALNLNGYKVVEELFLEMGEESGIENNGEFCADNNGEFVVEMCNEFVEDSLTKLFDESLSNEFKILGNSPERKLKVIQLIVIFTQWLKKYNFTNSVVLVNEEFTKGVK